MTNIWQQQCNICLAGDQIEQDKCINKPVNEDGIDIDMNVCVCKGNINSSFSQLVYLLHN